MGFCCCTSPKHPLLTFDGIPRAPWKLGTKVCRTNLAHHIGSQPLTISLCPGRPVWLRYPLLRSDQAEPFRLFPNSHLRAVRKAGLPLLLRGGDVVLPQPTFSASVQGPFPPRRLGGRSIQNRCWAPEHQTTIASTWSRAACTYMPPRISRKNSFLRAGGCWDQPVRRSAKKARTVATCAAESIRPTGELASSAKAAIRCIRWSICSKMMATCSGVRVRARLCFSVSTSCCRCARSR